MEIRPTDIPDVKIVAPKKHGDHRGFFAETYNEQKFVDAGLRLTWVQDNHSLSANKGVLRGLHMQIAPKAQDKLIRVIRGSILDVAVDLRKDSPTYLQHVKVVISAANFLQLFVPVGFAHGFVTLEENTEVLYKVTSLYSPEHERGIRYDDPQLGIDWGMESNEITLSERDKGLPPLREAELFA